MTRVLSLLGADLPSRLLEPRPDAVRGYWESADLLAIHDRLLEGAGLAWDEVLPTPESFWHTDAAQGFRREILEVLRRDFAASSLFVIKDPRICRLLPLWTSVLTQFDADPAFILCIRNPLEVIDSLKVRNRFHPARSALLWLRHVVEAESRSRGHRRAIVSYESLLRDWRGLAQRLARELGIVWPRLSPKADVAVESFLDRKLRHEDRTPDELRDRGDIVEWVRQVYAALMDAERGDAAALADTIDSVSRQMELADRTYVPILLELDQQLQGSKKLLAERELVARELQRAHELAARQLGELEVLKGEIAQAREAAARKDGEILALQTQIGAVEQDAATQKERAANTERELGAVQHRIAEVQRESEGRILALRDQLAAADRDAIALRNERENLGQELALARAVAERKQADAQALGRELSFSRDLAAHTELEIQALRDDVRRREGELDELAAQTTQLEQERSALRRELASRQAEQERLLEELDAKRDAISQRDARVGGLTRELSSARERARQMVGEMTREHQARVEGLQGDLARLQAEQAKLQANLDRLAARLVEKDNALDGQKARIVELEAALHTVVAERNSGAAQLQGALQTLVAERQAGAAQLEAARQSVVAEREAGAARARELEAALAARDVRIGQVEHELRTVLESTCWKLTGPARRLLSGNGRGTRLIMRRGPKVLWRVLTFQWRWGMLRRYLDRRVIEGSSTFDPEWYLANNPDVAAAGVRPLVHYLRCGAREGRDPNRFFDTSWYLEQNPDVTLAGVNPLAHYVRWGAKEARAPGPALVPEPSSDPAPELSAGPLPKLSAEALPEPSAEPVPSVPPSVPAPPPSPLDPASRALPARRSRTRPGRRILFVGHDGGLTGAPLILLNLVRQASRLCGVECVTVLGEGGPLEPQFAQVSRLYVLGHNRHVRTTEMLERHLAGVFKDLAGLDPFVAVCNSAETGDYVPLLKKMGIPTVTLVHEVLSLYSPHEATGILDADAIVFPAQFVAAANESLLATVAHRARLLPQGLLNPAFGSAAPVPRSTVFREQGVGDQSLIVLGCGTADWRKGFDLFCLVAEKVVSSLPDQDVRFCWVGHWEDTFQTAGYWGTWELRRRGLEKALIRIWEVPDPEPYFQAADLFLLTSRADPFPCVVHEAMAARLPVVAFEGAGGAPEAIRGDAGVVVPYGDAGAMADEVRRLLLDPERRRTLGEVGHSRVHQEYRFEDYGEKVLALACEAAGVPSRSLAGFPSRKETSKGRVVFSASDWSLSGVNTFTRELAAYLLDQGYEAEIVFTQDWALHKDRPYLPDVPFTFLEPESRTLPDRWQAFEACLAQRAPCVFIPNYDFAISAVSPRLPQDVGIIGIVHSDDVDHYEHAYRLGHYWNRIVAVSQAVGDEVVRLNPAFAGKTSVIQYGIDIKKPENGSADRASRPPGPLRLIYVGRFVEYQKRIMDYVALVRHLEARGVDFHLTMVGDGVFLEKVEHELRDSIRSGRVNLTGRLNQARTRAALREADVFLLLSDFEGLSLALIEALHLGCVPVVNRMRSGIPEVLTDGVNGYVVEPGDWDGIARHLEELQGSPALLQSLSTEGQATIRRCGLDRSTMGARYAALVDEVLAEIRKGRYQRPEALVPPPLRGVIPPPHFYVPMMRP